MSAERRAKHRSEDAAGTARVAVGMLETEGKERKEKKIKEKDRKDKDKDKDKDSKKQHHHHHHHHHSPSHRSRPADALPASPVSIPGGAPRGLLPSSASAPLGGALRPSNGNTVKAPPPTRGSADELVDYVLSVPPSEAPAVLSEFVCAFRYFVAPRELLLQLITRFKSAPAVGRYAPDEVQRDWKARSADALRGRVMGLLEAWVAEHFYDFEDDDVLFRSLLAFLDSSLASLPSQVGRVRHAIQVQSDEPLLRLFGAQLSPEQVSAALRKAGVAEALFVHAASDGTAAASGAELVEWLLANSALTSRAEAANAFTQMLRAGLLRASQGPSNDFRADGACMYVLQPAVVLCAPPGSPPLGAKLDSFAALSVADVARQLTLVAHEVFTRVRPADLKAPLAPLAAALSDGGQGSALHALQALHERTACWVASEVVLTKALPERAATLARFVALAAELVALHNYHGTFAVMAGLALKPVERLRGSWRAMSSEASAHYEALSELVAPAGAFAAYRAHLAQAALPAFPHVGLVLADVRALDTSASDFADDTHKEVNYKKLRALAAVFGQQIRPFQREHYAFPAVPAVQDYLARAVVITLPADLYKMSLQCEPLSA